MVYLYIYNTGVYIVLEFPPPLGAGEIFKGSDDWGREIKERGRGRRRKGVKIREKGKGRSAKLRKGEIKMKNEGKDREKGSKDSM